MTRKLITLGLLVAASTATAQTPAKETAPAPGPLRKFEVPPVQTATLPNGLKIAVVEKHSLPIVTARIQVDAGAVREPAAKSGVAVLTANILSEGSKQYTGAEIADKMAKLGAQFGTSGAFGSAWINVTSLPNVFNEAFTVASTTLTEPRFDEADFARIRNNQIASFENSMSNASGVANRVFVSAVYDPNTPYSRLSGGTKTSLEALTRDDVINWHKTMYSPANTTVMFVGDITLAQARSLVESALGKWTAPAASLAKLDNKVRPASGTRIILVDRPGSVQSSIMVGQGSIGWGTPDYYPMVALAQVLGGGFGSRINMNLREKHGWSYGAFSTFNPLVGAGTFYISSEVRTGATDSSIAESVKEFKRIVEEPVPATEVKDQLNNVVSSFPSSVQTVQGLMSRLANVVTYGLPMDFYTTYRERLAAITADDIARVGKAQLNPGAITVVAVGDLKTIEAPIRALNIGPVEVWTPDGQKVR
ncbi:MAG TPA: pitrilysin family protein [Gemmatimonadaceae bacterium]